MFLFWRKLRNIAEILDKQRNSSKTDLNILPKSVLRFETWISGT